MVRLKRDDFDDAHELAEPAALSVLSRMPPPQRFSEVPSPPKPASE
jgi:hypothetical protein